MKNNNIYYFYYWCVCVCLHGERVVSDVCELGGLTVRTIFQRLNACRYATGWLCARLPGSRAAAAFFSLSFLPATGRLGGGGSGGGGGGGEPVSTRRPRGRDVV